MSSRSDYSGSGLTRRGFTAALGAGAANAAGPARRPNILWITCEDTGPELGAYGDRYAVTPNLDRLAARGLRYRNAWSNAPVCAPARTTIISGMYPPSTGSEHMRSMTALPHGMRMYPQFLREAGYYATNNSQFCAMGFSIPGLVGSKLARPEHPVVAFCGDQSFVMTGMALATATEYGLSGVVIVLNNRTIQCEVEGAKTRFGRGVGEQYRIEKTGELWNPDICMIGQALRADVYKVSKPAEFKPALQKALKSNKLSILDVDTDITQKRYSVPLIAKLGTMPFPYTWTE